MTTTTISSSLGRLLRILGWIVLGALLGPVLVFLAKSDGRPELQAWHRYQPEAEFRAGGQGPADLKQYLDLEDELFEEIRLELAKHANPEAAVSRFTPGSPTCPWDFEVDDNRTFILEPQQVRGGAVLLHGLSDSPHSMRALGEVLAGEGYRVVGLRLPGHGTVPAGLLGVEVEDWRAAVRLAVRDVVGGFDADLPFVMAGYSNGAPLILDYTLASLEDDELETPDRLIMLSPAFVVTKTARLARWVHLASRVPGFAELGWTSINPEFDPYKYNSFTVNAGAQIYRLTEDVRRALTEIRSQGRQGEIPPILAFQSLVDATIPTVGTLERLLLAMENNGSHVVLFDVNDNARTDAVLAPFVADLRARIQNRKVHTFDATVVANRSQESSEVVAWTRRAGNLETHEVELGLVWPPGVYSLSHVALPFPSDDPVYGVMGGGDGVLPLGRLEVRGERRVLRIPSDLLLRLRYNPFFPYVETTVEDFVGDGKDPTR